MSQLYQLCTIKKIKKRLQKKLTKDIKILLKKKNKKKQQYGCESYKNLLEDDKQKLVEYRKKYYKMRKKKLYYTYKKHLFYEINFEAINLNLKKKS